MASKRLMAAWLVMALHAVGVLRADEDAAAAPRVKALRAAKAPVIDGKLDDAVWKQARKTDGAAAAGWVHRGKPDRKVDHPRTVYLAWDDDNLYVAMVAEVKDTEMLDVRQDRPELGDTIRVDSKGAATGIDCEGNNLGLLMPYLLPIRGATHIGDDRWTAELAIPWAHFGGKPKPGDVRPINLTGHDYKDGFITWTGSADPRQVKRFGRVSFEK